LQQLYEDGHSPKNPPKLFFTCFKMQAKCGSLCGLLHHIKIIILPIPLAISYKSTRRPFPPNFSSNLVFWALHITKNLQIGKCDIKLGSIFGWLIIFDNYKKIRQGA